VALHHLIEYFKKFQAFSQFAVCPANWWQSDFLQQTTDTLAVENAQEKQCYEQLGGFMT
jgi:hypothetical protein